MANQITPMTKTFLRPYLSPSAPAEQQQPGQRQRVGGDHPLQRGQAGVEVAADGGQRDADHGGVDRRDRRPEHGGQQHPPPRPAGEDQPRLCSAGRRRGWLIVTPPLAQSRPKVAAPPRQAQGLAGCSPGGWGTGLGQPRQPRPRRCLRFRPLRTLAGCSATMSEPGRACASRTLTRIQRRSPVRVSANPPASLLPCSVKDRCPGSSRMISAGALIPDDHRAGAARLPLVHALELTGRQRMVLDRHGQPPDRRVQRRALGHRPRPQHVAGLDPQVEMQRRRVVPAARRTGMGSSCDAISAPRLTELPARAWLRW